MKVIHSYRDDWADRRAWGGGPWENESDKYQLLDPATGLDALIVRGPHGSLCGYVGVSAAHPWWQVGYGRCTATPPCPVEPTDYDALAAGGFRAAGLEALKRLNDLKLLHGTEGWTHCEHAPEALITVHGGLTYSGHGEGPFTRERWEEWRDRMLRLEPQVRLYPRGDAADTWQRLGRFMGDYDGWAGWMRRNTISHEPAPGRPERLWWFGFDCAHSGDESPGLRSRLTGLLPGGWPPDREYPERYRTVKYVTRELTRLAAQLAAIAPASVAPHPVASPPSRRIRRQGEV